MRKLARASLVLALALLPAAAMGESLAIFPFELVNTSLEPVREEEETRLRLLDAQLADALHAQGHDLADLAPLGGRIAAAAPLRGCNGCELGLAREAGADRAVLGWVQKVSNLILNVNLQIRDAETGLLLGGGSADIRGNTDESWKRGLRSLLRRDVLRTAP